MTNAAETQVHIIPLRNYCCYSLTLMSNSKKKNNEQLRWKMTSNSNNQCFHNSCHWADNTINAMTTPLLQNRAEAHLPASRWHSLHRRGILTDFNSTFFSSESKIYYHLPNKWTNTFKWKPSSLTRLIPAINNWDQCYSCSTV